MNTSNSKSKPQIIGTIALALLLAASVVFFVTVFDANEFRAPGKLSQNFDRTPILNALSVEAVSNEFATIRAFGSRAPGQEGLEETARHIEKTFRDLGLEVFTQSVNLPYPLADGGAGTISTPDGDIEVHPFAPNFAQPVVTPAEGLTGTLFLATEENLRQASTFTDKIAVLDLAHPSVGNPAYLTSLGFKAVVVTYGTGLHDAPWQQLNDSMVDRQLPFNIVRVAAEPTVLNYIGQEVNLKCISRWRDNTTRNIFGVLRAPKPAKGVFVVPVTYDADSCLPDIAEGPFQALNTAVMLQLAKGLSACRGALERDVVFLAASGTSGSGYGESRAVSTVGTYSRRESARKRAEEEEADNNKHAAMLAEIRAMIDADPAFATADGIAATEKAIRALPPATRKFFAQRVSAVLRMAVFAQNEPEIAAEIEYKRNPEDLNSPAFARFTAEKKKFDDLNNISALPLNRALERPLARSKTAFVDADGKPAGIREALSSHIDLLIAYHAREGERIAQDKALVDLFAAYDTVLAVSPRLHPAKEDEGEKAETTESIGYNVGTARVISANNGEAANLFGILVNESIYAIGAESSVLLARPSVNDNFSATSGGLQFDSTAWSAAAFPAFSIVSPQNSASSRMLPFAEKRFDNLGSIRASLQVVGEVCATSARGFGHFEKLPIFSPYAMNGNVFASGIGNSVIPNYATPGVLVISLDDKPKAFTNPYGAFRIPFLTCPNVNYWYAPHAFHFGANGIADYVKDFGTTAQSIYKTTWNDGSGKPMNTIIYRGDPVAVLDIVNPQSMKSFTGLKFIAASGLAEFGSTAAYSSQRGKMDFIAPGTYFFVTFKAGAPGNDLVSVTRSFCLGVLHNGEDGHFTPAGEEIEGAGYLAADTPILRDIAAEAEASMAWLDGKRLELQNEYGMADDMTKELHDSAVKIAEDDAENGASRTAFARLRDMRRSLAFLILNHPVIRDSVSEAVMGILWYMGLLVPFIFFFEKLVFGFTDIRKQVLAEGAIFLVVFALLRILHPAFHMIRSSVMILLGFVIIIIVASVTSVLATKFQENLDAMRSAQGIVKGAHGNTFGIVLTAFMLGLNNMHRRKVRTGLTCATLVLMTFVMICFTSVQSNVVETEKAVGRASYQGIVVRDKDFAPIPSSEVDALRSSYGDKHAVCVRQAYTGSFLRWGANVAAPMNFAVSAGSGDNTITRTVKTGLAFNYNEPLRDSIKLLTTNGWFTAEQQSLAKGPYPIILPDEIAEQLAISPEDVNAGPVPVKISGREFFVWGIFDTISFPSVTDIDGENLLLFDVEAVTKPRRIGEYVVVDDKEPRVQPSDMIIGLVNQLPATDWACHRITSVVIDMGDSTYSTARQEINSYLVQTGRETVYGLDGTAFTGRRARARSMSGVADLIIPLIIAALTVLNTMKGSVYERKSEIFVYNAVGIAPKYIFFMFVAEALVYSVVGAVLGYILSQGTGRILTALGLTGGMNMNFTSVTTIYASLAIAAATLASTWFPARSAIEIAKPTDDAGWTLPSPGEDDSISFSLPFTFTRRDRIAVLSFFYRYFENLGEGSSGAFFSGQPRLAVADYTDDLANGAYVPRLEVQVWLKPFDLGVSEMITIDLPTDPDTGEFIARMRLVRVTGTRDAWIRLNKPMVAHVRRQFLHWRAVDSATKETYFTEAKDLLLNWRKEQA